MAVGREHENSTGSRHADLCRATTAQIDILVVSGSEALRTTVRHRSSPSAGGTASPSASLNGAIRALPMLFGLQEGRGCTRFPDDYVPELPQPAGGDCPDDTDRRPWIAAGPGGLPIHLVPRISCWQPTTTGKRAAATNKVCQQGSRKRAVAFASSTLLNYGAPPIPSARGRNCRFTRGFRALHAGHAWCSNVAAPGGQRLGREWGVSDEPDRTKSGYLRAQI